MEALLDGVEDAVALEAFHGRDLVALGGRGQHRAGLHRLAVHQHDARPAVGGVAAPVGAGQAELVAQEVHEQQPRLDVARVLLPVDRHRDLHRRPVTYRCGSPGASRRIGVARRFHLFATSSRSAPM